MKLIFSPEDKQKEINKIYIEQDDIELAGEYIEGEGKNYIICGVATIEGERYHEFEVEFELAEEPEEMTCEAIMEIEWEWYDFLC